MAERTLKSGATYKVKLFGARSWNEATFLGNDRWILCKGTPLVSSAVTEIGPELGPIVEVAWQYDPFAVRR